MSYSERIRKCIQAHFEKDEWYYTFDEEEGVFRAKIKLDGRLNRCELTVRIHEDYYVAYSGMAINADEKSIPLVAEYLHRANYGLKMGSFELDYNDGEIRFKVFVDCGDACDCLPSESILYRSLEMGGVMFDTYGEGILDIIFKNTSPVEALTAAESEQLTADED